jgi:predicted transposase/invertase (TIGR01784 family)
LLNPRILPEDLTGKPIELDVLARDSTGHLFNVEVQVLRYPRWSARSTFYLARMLSTQIDAGEHYLAIKPVVGVHLLDFDLVEGHQSALWQFEMRDRHDPSVRLGDELTLFVVGLGKADRLLRARDDRGDAGTSAAADIDANADAHAHAAAALEAWIKFFKHWKEAQAMSDLSYPPVQ